MSLFESSGSGSTAVEPPGSEIIQQVEQRVSGKKPLPLSVRRKGLHRQTAEWGYEVQLDVERQMLGYMGYTDEQITEVISKWAGKRAQWYHNLDASTGGLMVGWGGASPDCFNDPALETVKELSCRICRRIVDRDGDIMTGGSTTAFMGLMDNCFTQAAKDRWGEEYLEHINVWTIPLNWTTDDIRETPPKNGRCEHRCPPHLNIGPRTEDFFHKRPQLFLVNPGGLGTCLEVFLYALSWQLRNHLITACSDWETPAPIVFLDYEQNIDTLPASQLGPLRAELAAQGRTLADVGIESGWFFDGLNEHLTRMVLGKFCNQNHIDIAYVLRVVEPGTRCIDRDFENQIGPRVKYFTSTDAAANFAASLYDAAAITH